MKKLVLIGTGPHHVHLLLSLTQQALEGVQVTLVAPSLRQLYGPMLPGFVAGRVSLEECLIDLEPRLKKSGIRYLPFNVAAVDSQAQTVTLTNGSSLGFDWLSLNNADVPDRAQLELQLPGVREHGLFLQPTEVFAKLWPSVVAMAETRTLRIAVLGDSLQSMEIAMAIRHRLPAASITLVMDRRTLAPACSAALQAQLTQALKQRRITVLDDHAVSLANGQVVLGCGAALVCDVPLLALRAPAPGWLATSALALDEQGFVATDALQRAISHPNVFAADGAVMTDVQTVWRRRAAQVASDSMYGQALTSAIKSLPAGPARGPEKSAFILADGGHTVLASWEKYSFQGRWLWRLKNRLDRASVQRLRLP
jgi:NADH dehydrogenase FAD-containing subunit